jgi:hypothetical protein
MTLKQTSDAVAVTGADADLQIGQVQWHSSEEDGGPDVGILLRLDADHHLWWGELLAGEGDGFGAVIYGPGNERKAFETAYDELRQVFEDYVAPALRHRLASTRPMTEDVAGLVERLQSHMGMQDVPVLLADCREAAATIQSLQSMLAEATTLLESWRTWSCGQQGASPLQETRAFLRKLDGERDG